MNNRTDHQLLAEYAAQRSEAAFAELVRRHVDLVHSAALRLVRDAHAAQDVTQAVFLALAQNARQLTDRPALEGWLHGTTRNLAANALRSEVRRRAREQEAALMNELLAADPDARWEHIAPQLDDALGELDEPDREALLLRYFKNHDLRTVGATLGISDDAAQKRVSRAVERLRECFAKRGLTVGAGGLVGVISANAVQAAPVGLSVAISTAAALAGTTATIATHTTMHWLNLKSIAAMLAAALTAGTVTHFAQHREVNRLRGENQNLVLQQETLTQERDAALSATTQRNEESEQFQKDKTELLRLRGEVGGLRRQIIEFGKLREQNSQYRGLPAPTQAAVPGETQKPQPGQVTTNTINAMKQIGLAVRLYALEHQNAFATSFEQITNKLPPRFVGNIGLDAFEFIQHAVPVNDRENPDKIIVRERVARQTPEGKWARVYGLADGHVVEELTADGNFEVWEKQH